MSFFGGIVNPWGGMLLWNGIGVGSENCGSGELIIKADLGQIGTVSANFTSLRDTLTTIATDSRTTVNDTVHAWTGTDADAFRTVGQTAAATVNSLVAPLDTVIGGYTTFIQSITYIRDLVESVLDVGDAAAHVAIPGVMTSPSSPSQFSSITRGAWAVGENNEDTLAGIQGYHPMPECPRCRGIDWNIKSYRDNPPPAPTWQSPGSAGATYRADPDAHFAPPSLLEPTPVDCACVSVARDIAAARDADVQVINTARIDLLRHMSDAAAARTAFQTTAEQAYAALSLSVDSSWGAIVDVPLPGPEDSYPDGTGDGGRGPGGGGPDGGPGGGPSGGPGGGGRGPGGAVPSFPGPPPELEVGEIEGLETEVPGLGTEVSQPEPVALAEPTDGTSVDGSEQTPPPDARWVTEQLATRDVTDGTWTITDDARWNAYMLSDPEFQDRVATGSTDACRDAVGAYLRTGTSVGEFVSTTGAAPGSVTDGPVEGAGRHGAGPVDVPAARPSFGDRLGALPPQDAAAGTVGATQPEHDPGDLTHAGSTSVVPLGDGRFAVTLDVEHTYSDRIEPGETFEPGSWQDGARELLTDGIEEPYDLEVTWTEQQTVVLDAQGQVYTLEPVDEPAMSGQRWL